MSWENLTEENLRSLSTGRLLNVLKLQRRKTLSINGPVCSCGEGYNCFAGEPWSKEDLESLRVNTLKTDLIKSILSDREHVDVMYESHPPHTGKIKNIKSAIGFQVYKKSKKPFKSGYYFNTVKSITKNPNTGRDAFEFEEDLSIVDAHICIIKGTVKEHAGWEKRHR